MKKMYFTICIVCFSYLTVLAGNKIKVYQQFTEIESYLQPKDNGLLVVNFWASWCRPCVEELPALEKVRKELEREDIQFLLVNLDDPKKLESHVIPLLGRLKIEADVILLNDTDYNSWIDKVDPSWSGAIPGTLLVHKDDKQFYEKSFNYEQFKTLIINHLK